MWSEVRAQIKRRGGNIFIGINHEGAQCQTAFDQGRGTRAAAQNKATVDAQVRDAIALLTEFCNNLLRFIV